MSPRCERVPASRRPTSWPSSTRPGVRDLRAGSCTRRRCRYVGDELHHFGWNRCSSACHGPDRSHLILPGFRSSRIYVVNVADDPLRPQIEKVIEPDEITRATGYTRPHTTHCMPGENVVISMLGDAEGNAAGGFAVIDATTFEVKGRWENGGALPPMNYDFWYQPRKNDARLQRVRRPERLRAGLRPRRRRSRPLRAAAPLLEPRDAASSSSRSTSARTGLVPLEIRWKHDPEADEGFVGAALSSTLWHFHRANGSYAAEPVVAVEPVDLDGWPIPVPGLITDLVLSMDDKALYFSNWLHGDLRRYDVSDPANPQLTGRLWLGGVLGKESDAGRPLTGGPQMLQLSYDGRRLYVTNSLLSSWDNQFYPGLRSYLLKVDIGDDGSMAVDPDFFVDFHDRPDGPARAHEVRLQGGDSTSEVFP